VSKWAFDAYIGKAMACFPHQGVKMARMGVCISATVDRAIGRSVGGRSFNIPIQDPNVTSACVILPLVP